ncbi:Retrovirus-related Pol polyprotein from transposon TNT 1-94 [Sesamum angolense]|uniref:Retrovirus-related Pol polyprotein from transposon TNT 1-94 n=1 Tax=Sesamum angolense TaxID=2727404 RepID=A0AAE1VZR3_9LAMI|nr:Retrovirus-related Pol polyprotein from transposon TNT 1-94 [Sesamum angolense]
MRGYNFIKNEFDPCVQKKISRSTVAYLVLYVDDILLIGNDVKMLGDVKAWLSNQFSIKDMVLKIFKMENSNRGFIPMRHRIKLSKKQSSKTNEELKRMSDIPYVSAVGSIHAVGVCSEDGEFQEEDPSLSKYDRGISYALGDAFTLYEAVATVIGRIGKRGSYLKQFGVTQFQYCWTLNQV